VWNEKMCQLLGIRNMEEIEDDGMNRQFARDPEKAKPNWILSNPKGLSQTVGFHPTEFGVRKQVSR
jgi:hypothetical protein